MRSSVKGTLGSMVRIDRVRKSSGGMEGMFIEEKERAAFRRARRLAVKFDLKADLIGWKASLIPLFFSSLSGEESNTLKSSSSKSDARRERGCCSNSPGGEDTGVKELLVGLILRPRVTLCGLSTEENVSVENESVREGTDSQETVRVDNGDAIVLSPMDRLSSSMSSGGLNSTSSGPLMKLRLSSFSDS